jgi:hypothetical protein
MPDAAGCAATHLEQDLGQLRGLARTGLAANDDYRVVYNGSADLVALGVDRQGRLEGGARRGQLPDPGNIRST